MAKLPDATAPATTSRAQEVRARRMTDKLRGYHEIGREANERTFSTVELAAKHGLSVSTMRKAREFAREYSKSHLERLCRRRRRGESGDGLPLHWGHVQYLLIAAPEDRAQLEEQACENNWTSEALYAEIRRRRPDPKPRRSGGRPVWHPSSYSACVEHLLLDGKPWIRRAKGMLNAFPAAKKRELDARGRQQTEEAVQVLSEMAALARAMRDQLRKALKNS